MAPQNGTYKNELLKPDSKEAMRGRKEEALSGVGDIRIHVI